jgi:hypothetical protein
MFSPQETSEFFVPPLPPRRYDTCTASLSDLQQIRGEPVMSKMTRLMLLSLALLPGACGGSTALPSSWITFTSKDGGFSIGMPENPKEQNVNAPTPVGNLAVTIYMVEKPDAVFMASFNDYPDDVLKQGPESLLDGAQNGAIANVKGKLISSKKITLGSNPGREFEFQALGGEGIARQRLYLVKNRLYAILVLAKGKSLPKETEAFLTSFKLN